MRGGVLFFKEITFLSVVRYTSSMKVTTQATRVTLTPTIEELLEKVAQAVERMLGGSIAPEDHLVFEVERASAHHRKGGIWRAEATLYRGKVALRAETFGDTLPEAVDLLNAEICREIRHHRGKNTDLARKGARTAKRNATVAKAARKRSARR